MAEIKEWKGLVEENCSFMVVRKQRAQWGVKEGVDLFKIHP